MTRILVRVKDDRKVVGLVRFLRDMDFLDVKVESTSGSITLKTKILNQAVGIWKNKNISLNSLRQKAWRC
jgi:flagellar biosynthesis chaperone FliJ